MALWQKRSSSPVDRAVAELEAEIATVERQARQLTVAAVPSKTVSPAETMAKFMKEMLTPPSNKPMPVSYQTRKDLFDVTAEPMKDLAAEPITFAAAPGVICCKPIGSIDGAAGPIKANKMAAPKGRHLHR